LEERIAERTSEPTSANLSLRELSSRLLQTQDEERRRIARDLHDGVGQLLVGMKLNNSAVLRGAARLGERSGGAMAASNSMIGEFLKSIRTISPLLHPPLLEEAGLTVALKWYVEEFSSRSDIQVTFENPTPLERLSTEAETNIFRIVQECLGNVHRHSK